MQERIEANVRRLAAGEELIGLVDAVVRESPTQGTIQYPGPLMPDQPGRPGEGGHGCIGVTEPSRRAR